jgi:hypothetical protein
MDDESARGSWWKTLPGVLTAVGALVTALVGGVVGLKQAGIIFSEGKPPAQGGVGNAAQSVAPPRRDAARLSNAHAPPWPSMHAAAPLGDRRGPAGRPPAGSGEAAPCMG